MYSKYDNIIKRLAKNYIQSLFRKYFKLNSKKKSKMSFMMELSLILQMFKINVIFTRNLLQNLIKKSYFDLFFDIYLFKTEALDLEDQLEREVELKLTIPQKIIIREKLLRNYSWYKIYSLLFSYFYFVFEWELNFRSIIIPYNFYIDRLIDSIQDPFSKLKIEWDIKCVIELRELYLFFFRFLNNIVQKFRKLLYLIILKNMNINYKF